MAQDQLPRLSELKTPAIDALVALRPRAGAHIVNGRWGDLIEGWAAQAALCRNRTAKEILAARLRLAAQDSLQALIELAAELSAELDTDPQAAVGEIAIGRFVTNASGATTGNFGNFGFIPKGFRVRRPGDPVAFPVRTEATYHVTEPVLVQDEDLTTVEISPGQFVHTQVLEVPIEADRTGSHANVVVQNGITDLTTVPGALIDTPFDTRLQAAYLLAAGGTNGPSESQLIRFAQAAYSGQHGPIDSALLAGAFSHAGVKHVGLALDTARAVSKLWIADESWGGSKRLTRVVSQKIRDGWLGFGGRVDVGYILNYPIGVKATVMLSSPDYSDDVSKISDRIRTRVAAYFDDRPDWWAWKSSTLQGVVARADRRILTCTAATVIDANGDTLTEPSGQLSPTVAYHWMLSGNSMNLTFVLPS